MGRRTSGPWVPVTVLSLVPAWPLETAPTDVPAFFTSDAVHRIPYGSVVLISPYPSVAEVQPQAWQAVANMHFRIIGGYALVAGTNGADTPFPQVLRPMQVQRFLWARRRRPRLPGRAGAERRHACSPASCARSCCGTGRVGDLGGRGRRPGSDRHPTTPRPWATPQLRRGRRHRVVRRPRPTSTHGPAPVDGDPRGALPRRGDDGSVETLAHRGHRRLAQHVLGRPDDNVLLDTTGLQPIPTIE